MSTISEADSRSMIRLLGETAAIQGGHAEMKRFLMNGLCDLIGADAWVWTLSIIIVPGGLHKHTPDSSTADSMNAVSPGSLPL